MHQHNYSEYGKTSTKVHHPPGGGSQWSMSWDDSAKQNVSAPGQVKGNSQFQQQQYQQQDDFGYGRKGGYQQKQHSSSFGYGAQDESPHQVGYGQGIPRRNQQQHQQFTSGTDQSGSPNRGGGMRSEHNIGDSNRTSVKVHNPPGGRSNINIFGGGDEPQPRQNQGLGSSYQVGASYQIKQGQMDRDAFESRDMNKGYGGQRQQKSGYGYQQQQPQQQYSKYPAPKQISYQDDGRGGYQMSTQQQSHHYDQYQDYPSAKPQYGGRQQQQSYGYQQSSDETFGQRVESGWNSGPTTGKSSTKLHAPPGGKSSLQLF